MTAAHVEVLRLMLPRALATHAPQPVRCAALLADGSWQCDVLPDLAALAARYRPRRLEACPHPADISMTAVELPPLPGSKLHPAVHGAVELLALTAPEHLSIGFGPRHAGKVPIAWTSALQLAHVREALSCSGLQITALYPPPAFLPSPDDADQDHAASAVVIDDWIVARTGPDTGELCPLPVDRPDAAMLEHRLRTCLPGTAQVRWFDADTPATWCGTGWHWPLPGGRSAHRRAGWLRPALGWGATALAVWLLGLNLYAHRIEREGQALRRDMAAQVHAAFPQLSVVLNPLQQARQMRDARNTRSAPVISNDFAALVAACAALLPHAGAQVERLTYQGGQLGLTWREGATLSASERETLRAQAAERSLVVQIHDSGVGIQVAASDDAGAAPPTNTEPSP
jgi:general secretion pathway protein L